LNVGKCVEKSLKTLKATSRKSKLLLLAIGFIILIFGVATLIQSSLRNGSSVNECTISQIMSESEEWENKTVKVEGTVEEIPLGIIQPFNYWLSDKQNQTIRIGLRWHSDNNLSGRNLTVVGVVKKRLRMGQSQPSRLVDTLHRRNLHLPRLTKQHTAQKSFRVLRARSKKAATLCKCTSIAKNSRTCEEARRVKTRRKKSWNRSRYSIRLKTTTKTTSNVTSIKPTAA
jgi:hypothetical protein